MTLHMGTQSMNRLMAALLMLVIGVIGPVQASVHTASMTGHAAQAELVEPASTLPDRHSSHADQLHEQQHSAHSEERHPGADGLCVELCLMMTLVPPVNSGFAHPVAQPFLTATIGEPIAQVQPAIPPPRHLF